MSFKFKFNVGDRVKLAISDFPDQDSGYITSMELRKEKDSETEYCTVKWTHQDYYTGKIDTTIETLEVWELVAAKPASKGQIGFRVSLGDKD